MNKIDEKKLVDLLKTYYEASKKEEKVQVEIFLHIVEHFGKNLEEFEKFRKKEPTRHGTDVYLKYLCPVIHCGDKPMPRKANKYVCSVCGLSFDAKIWDNAVRAILEYRKAMSELGKLENRFIETDYMTYEEEQELKKKYGKEPWWDSTRNWRMRFMGMRE